MSETHTRLLLEKLAALRTELIDRAFVLDRRGRLDAADEAMTVSVRIGELCEELAVTPSTDRRG